MLGRGAVSGKGSNESSQKLTWVNRTCPHPAEVATPDRPVCATLTHIKIAAAAARY